MRWHDAADYRADRPDARYLRASGRGLSRARLSGWIEGPHWLDQPVAGIDPRGHAGAGGTGTPDPSTHLGRPDPDREGASAVRGRDHAGRYAGSARTGRDRAPDRPRSA